MPAPYDPRYLAGIEYFNTCDFYEAHEVWEELWQDYSGPSRKFYQGGAARGADITARLR